MSKQFSKSVRGIIHTTFRGIVNYTGDFIHSDSGSKNKFRAAYDALFVPLLNLTLTSPVSFKAEQDLTVA